MGPDDANQDEKSPGDAVLRELQVCRNGITDVGARSLADALATNKTLRVLNMRDNQLGDTGTVAIAEACKKNFSLKELDLSLNRVSDWGAKELGMTLIVNCSLVSLYLFGNQVSDEGVKGLVTGLERNGSLQELDLRKNRVGDGGVAYFAGVLVKNLGLTELSLEDNDASEVVIEQLAETMRARNTLTLTPHAPDASASDDEDDELHEDTQAEQEPAAQAPAVNDELRRSSSGPLARPRAAGEGGPANWNLEERHRVFERGVEGMMQRRQQDVRGPVARDGIWASVEPPRPAWGTSSDAGLLGGGRAAMALDGGVREGRRVLRTGLLDGVGPAFMAPDTGARETRRILRTGPLAD